MIPPQLPPNETERLAALFRQQILDSEEETGFNEIVELAARLFSTKISLISLVDDHRQWFKAKVGLDISETPKAIAFCGHALHGDQIFEVPNTLEDERFADNPLVTGEPKIRFYAGQPIHSADGYKLGTLCLIDDQPRQLTAEQQEVLKVLAKQVEQQLALRSQLRKQSKSLQLIQAQAASLQQLNQIKDQILGVLSHDLRSPLTMLEGVIQLFNMEALEPEDISAFMQEIDHKVRQTKVQLSQVLQWSQQQLIHRSALMEPILLTAITDQVLPWIQTQASKKQVCLRTNIEQNLQVEGDMALINLVLRNLLTNAVKYSRRGDTVTLFAISTGDLVRLGVSDTGLGMKPEILQKLRDHTYQMSIPGTDNEGGTGLGLLLCQTYLNQMNTHLEIESVWTQGSTFSFQLAITP